MEKPGFIEKCLCLENVKNLLTSRNYMKGKSLERKQGQIREEFLENFMRGRFARCIMKQDLLKGSSE